MGDHVVKTLQSLPFVFLAATMTTTVRSPGRWRYVHPHPGSSAKQRHNGASATKRPTQATT